MKQFKLFLFSCLFFNYGITFSQTLHGVVLDNKNKIPIESVSIYFDDTTFGTITNSKGEFSIKFSEAIQSPLIISYLGYEKQIITDYRSEKNITILLEEKHESLNEVVINANDGLTRAQKLKLFRQEFLGTSKFGKSCTIQNEDALILKYNKKQKTLTASATAPILIENTELQYLITYDLIFFSAKFNYANAVKNSFELNTVSFRGNPYYQNMPLFDSKKATNNREKAYQGSILQFMRALYAENLRKKKFKTYTRNFNSKPEKLFQINFHDSTLIKKVAFKQNDVTILFKDKQRSGMQISVPYFLVDKYGNYSDVFKISFSGYLGSKRFGDLLPFDYGLG